MATKLPLEAFSYYYALGAGRSYQAVAKHFKVSKRTVTNRALKENWQDEVAKLDQEARNRANEKFNETVEQMCERHSKQIRVIQGRAIEALRQMPLDTAMEAVRALALAMKEERTLRCGPENEGDDVEAIIKREYERWMVRSDDEEGGTDESQ